MLDRADRAPVKLLDPVAAVYESLKALVDRIDVGSGADGCANHGPHHAVHSLSVSTGGEDGDGGSLALRTGSRPSMSRRIGDVQRVHAASLWSVSWHARAYTARGGYRLTESPSHVNIAFHQSRDGIQGRRMHPGGVD